MLQSLRSALKGVVVWFVIALLILAFALFGVPEIQNFTRNAAVRVGDQGVTTRDIQKEFNRAVTTRRFESEGGFTRADAIAAGLPDQIVQALAMRSAVEQEADKLGLVMPRTLVRDILSSEERFQNPETGTFDLDVLGSIVRNYDYTVQEFEKQIRSDLNRGQILESLASGGGAPSAMVEPLALRIFETRTVSFVTITDEMAGVREESDPDKLKAYYEENPARFTKPEYRTFRVLSFRRSDMREGLDAPEDGLRKLYKAQKAQRFVEPERRTLYQLPFPTEAAATAAAGALRGGADIEAVAADNDIAIDAATFEEVAKSAILDAAVADAAFSADLGEGDVSDAIDGIFGWKVVVIETITPPETTSFEDARDELEEQLLEADVRKRIFDALELVEDARDAGDDFLETGAQAGGKVTTYGPVDSVSFGPKGEIVEGVLGEELAEAFRMDEGEEGEAIEYGEDGGYFYVALDAITPQAVSPYEEVADDVEKAWNEDERRRRVSRAVKQIRDALEAGADLKDAAAPFGAEPEVLTTPRQPQTDAVSRQLVAQVFQIDLGAFASGPSPKEDGAQTVAVVDAVAFDRGGANPVLINQFAQGLGEQMTQEMIDAYFSALRVDYDIRIDQSQIDALFSGAS
ncbi:MAG: SurA N-terminal domain-containing protein [Pseudomonadota bacterium]